MAKPISDRSELNVGRPVASDDDLAGEDSALAELASAFQAATGWPLRWPRCDAIDFESSESTDSMRSAPVNPGVGISPGRMRVGFNSPRRDAAKREAPTGCAFDNRAPQRCSAEAAERLAEAIARLPGQGAGAQQSFQPIGIESVTDSIAASAAIAMADSPEQFDRLLASVLHAGADCCDCQAAAFYLLDDMTTSLALRASFGLPVDRSVQPPRPLKGAVADLEALLGHAVALERASAFGPWRVPEEFAAALCVPVSSDSTPLGTLWFFSDRPRDFTDCQTNMAEIVAGRLAAELERATLLAFVRSH